MANNQIENYKTKDLAEAAMLIVRGQKLITIEKEGRIGWFVFDNKNQCEQLSNKYYFDEILVNARLYHEAIS